MLTDQITLKQERFARNAVTGGVWFHYRFGPGEPRPTEDGDGLAGDLLADDRLVMLPREARSLIEDGPLELIDRVGNLHVAGRTTPDPIGTDSEALERVTWLDGGYVTAYERWHVNAGTLVAGGSRRLIADRPTSLRPPDTYRTVDIHGFEENVWFATIDIPTPDYDDDIEP